MLRCALALMLVASAVAPASALEVIGPILDLDGNDADKAERRSGLATLLSNRIRDPNGAIARNTIFAVHRGAVAYCGELNAKNAFGGFTGFRPYMLHFQKVNGELKIDLDTEETYSSRTGFENVWNSYCRKN